VTGASRGIGRGIAHRLARQGYGLTITSRTESDLVALAAGLIACGAPQVVYRAANMANPDELGDLVGVHGATFGTMDALIVNAGVGTAGSIGEFDLGRLDRLIGVNFTAGFVLMQGSLPLLRAAAAADRDRGAKIVALSSITGVYSEPELAAYGATKAALLSLVETLNLEESGNGVTASAVAPAFVNTDMTAYVADRVPADTMITVDDVVSVVDMLLGLSRHASITRVVMARSGTTGYCA
jgi:3-oxoacyl-[acyl-carrier protein] reductase